MLNQKKSVLKVLLLVSFTLSLCIPLFTYTEVARAETVEEKEARLKAELAAVEAEIAAQQKILSVKQRESVSLERDVAILNAEISQARLKIRAHNITIERLSKDINVKSATIGELNKKIVDSKGTLAQLLRKTNELDRTSMATVMLGSKDLSEVFADLDTFDSVNESLHSLMTEVAEARDLTEVEKTQLASKRTEASEARSQIEVQKKKVEAKEAEKKRLLSLSKSEEQNYQKVINDKQARAAAIRSALFTLRDSAAIPFGTALQYANEASRKTGVRAAFILAILTQESNLGQNVGACLLTNATTGDGKTITTGIPKSKTMNPTRDVPPFLQITKALGRDPYNTRVSCPWDVGWGGAMGPSQFIASTWMMYNAKIQTLVGATPDPWNPYHAFTATALFVKDLGAAQGTYAAEREAALRYYAGGNWSLPRNAFYGNEVMAKAAEIQINIDLLQSL